jgi:stage IV sporulation protein FA
MQIRDSVRERRRERIQQLIGEHAKEEATKSTERFIAHTAEPERSKAEFSRLDTAQPPTLSAITESDPELWWKEREKRLKAGNGGWQGLKGLPGIPPAPPVRTVNSIHKFDFNKFMRGFSWRLVCSAVLFAAIWGWFKLEMPGSVETRKWMVYTVTRDMDFKSIEAWYGNTFGGSPSFLPFNQGKTDTKEVSLLLSPEETVIPVQGRVVQSFAQSQTGVEIAATGSSNVLSIFTGRVQQVTNDQDGGVTILVLHPNRILTVYGGLEKSIVKPNDWVKTGQTLGQLKMSGDSEGVLYFAVQQNGKTLDPADVVSFD